MTNLLKHFRICIRSFSGTIFIFAFILCNAQDNDRIQLLLNSADNQIRVLDYSTALENVNEVLKLSPNNIEALTKKINIFLLMENDKDAYRTADEAVELYPDVMDLFLLRGIVNLTKRKDSKAIEDFDHVISNSSDRKLLAKASLNRGMAYYSLQEFDRAVEDLSTAIEMDVNNATMYHSRGMVYYEMKEYESAIRDFKKAIEIEDENGITYYNLGMAYYRMEDYDNACINFNKACSYKSRNACKMVLMECASEINFPD